MTFDSVNLKNDRHPLGWKINLYDSGFYMEEKVLLYLHHYNFLEIVSFIKREFNAYLNNIYQNKLNLSSIEQNSKNP